MFTLEIKTNRPWSLPTLELPESTWTKPRKGTFPSLKAAEIELSYLQQQFLDFEDLKNLEVNYRILNEKAEVLFEKRHKF